MQRRGFFELAAVAAAARAKASGEPPRPRPVLMKAGSQHSVSDADLKIMSAFGVNHVCGTLPSRSLDQAWSVEALMRLRERVESHGIQLDMVPLPLSSLPIERAEMPNIMLGKSPERDREIDQLCEMIRNVSRAGIPAVKYNLNILGVVRTEPTSGRGGARLSTFVYDQARQEPPLTAAGKVTSEMSWERIEYFLRRVVPVAQECKVRMACHPHDPGMPEAKGFRGVSRVLGSVAGLKKFVSMRPSPYHGLNFCQGTVAEMLQDPGKEIYDVIRYFGSRRKIFNVHFRNIRGRRDDFIEVFPDEGDVDMVKAIQTYKEVGYPYMLMPDHVPSAAGDPGGLQSFAFCYGYIRALLQAV